MNHLSIFFKCSILFVLTLKSGFSATNSKSYIIDRTKLSPFEVEQPEVVGFYSSGCILGAKKVANFGPGYQVANIFRGRNFAHDQLLEVFEPAMKSIYDSHKKYFYVGDFSLSRGGPTRTGHSSHQNGLDVDIFFETVSKAYDEQSNTRKWFVSFIKEGAVNKLIWTAAHDELVSTFARDVRVDRIFINKTFKRYFCENKERLKLSDDHLKKIRPWYGHDDHIHVRVKCPKNSKSCVAQAPIDESATCGKDLEWWFTEEATYEKSAYSKTIEDIKTAYLKKLDALPEACKKVISR